MSYNFVKNNHYRNKKSIFVVGLFVAILNIQKGEEKRIEHIKVGGIINISMMQKMQKMQISVSKSLRD
jgi:hypothetical protein